MPYQHIFFDLDHTLWDFETNSGLTIEKLYHEFALDTQGISSLTDFFNSYTTHNNRLWKRYTQGFIKQDELRWKRMWFSLLDFKIADEALAKKLSAAYLDELPNRAALFPHTMETLQYLQSKDYQLYIITNGFEEVQLRKLAYSQLAPFFKEVVTSQKAQLVKPDAAIFAYTMQLAQALPEQCIMIGDNQEADIQGGINAGIDTVWVNHTQATATVPATYTITGLDQLLNIL
jgi:putative hydrolase of the HAD superfamily